MRKRITYRPNKAASALGLVVGILFVGLGFFVVIPTFGAFGVLWTLIALGITVANGYQAFGSRYVGPEIHIEEDDPSPAAPAGEPGDVKGRLEQLEGLRSAGLITGEEYEAKRREILDRL